MYDFVGFFNIFIVNKNVEEANKIIEDVEQKYSIKAKAYRLNVLEPEQYTCILYTSPSPRD
ncbi:hypothetical protein HpBGD120_15150 [Helicobacter pylori]